MASIKVPGLYPSKWLILWSMAPCSGTGWGSETIFFSLWLENFISFLGLFVGERCVRMYVCVNMQTLVWVEAMGQP